MNIPFWKMHGAANDFILADDREESFPIEDRDWLARVAARRTGIGCEGVILIQPSRHSDFRMRFFNPDGSEVEMCGNGARCVARLAHDIGAAPQRMTIETIAGELKAEVNGELVRLHMTEPKDWVMNGTLDIQNTATSYHFVNSGVPHVVIEAEDIDALDIQSTGAAIRYHPAFAPAGTNVNFAQIIGPNALRIRTYERGVESETLACGTGMVAAALTLAKAGRVQAPVQCAPASGDLLEVNFLLSEDGVSQTTLTGPAVYVFEGSLNYPEESP